MQGRGLASGAAPRPVLPRRGAQRRHPRLDVHQGLQAKGREQGVSRLCGTSLPPDFHSGAGTPVEGRRPGGGGAVRQRVSGQGQLPHGSEEHGQEHWLRPAFLHAHGVARAAHASAIRRDAAPVWRLCRRILGAQHQGDGRQLLQGFQLQGVPQFHGHSHRGPGRAEGTDNQGRRAVPVLHMRAWRRHDTCLPPPCLPLSRGRLLAGGGETGQRQQPAGLLHVSWRHQPRGQADNAQREPAHTRNIQQRPARDDLRLPGTAGRVRPAQPPLLHPAQAAPLHARLWRHSRHNGRPLPHAAELGEGRRQVVALVVPHRRHMRLRLRQQL